MNAAEEVSAAFCFLFGWGRGGATQSTLELKIEIVNMRAIAPVVNALYTGIKDNALHLFYRKENQYEFESIRNRTIYSRRT